MAVKTEAKHDENQVVVKRAKDFWTNNNRPIMIIGAAIILLAAGYLGYKYFIQKPQNNKAIEAMFKAEEYYRMDSLQKALNGDGLNQGFLKIIDKHGSSNAGNLAKFYAGDCYLKLGDFNKAAQYLKDFDTDSKPIQARAYKLLGDAYAEAGKNNDALESYKKAGRHFEEDEANSSEYLFVAAYFAEKVLNKPEEAKDLYRELKKRYPRSQRGFEADKYLARLGEY